MKQFRFRFFRALIAMAVPCLMISCKLNAQPKNEVEVGTSHLKIRMLGECPLSDNIFISMGLGSVLGNPFETRDYEIAETGNGVYEIDVPVELHKSIAVLKIADKREQAFALGFIELINGDTLAIDCTFSHDNWLPEVTISNRDGFNGYSMGYDKNVAAYISDKFYNMISSQDDGRPLHGITDAEKVYAAGDKAWQEVLWQNDAVYLPLINDETAKEYMQDEERAILKNNMHEFIYGMEYLRYDRMRDHWASKGNRDLPPLEYYDFLNRIDFDYLLDFIPFYSPNHIAKRILKFLPVGIEPIGETPVRKWKADTKKKLGKVMKNVPDNLLDMLSASSYWLQLNEENTPFSPVQIKNISKGYKNDLGKILLSQNEKLEAQLKSKPKVWDIRDAKITFDLKTYIDAYYKGRPVVVDFWNTWCMPCLKAHGQTEELRKGPDGDGVVFLYISDSSSKDDAEFDKISMELGGEHLRLAQDVAFTYLESEGFNSFPTYFFFDRNHNLVHKQTAFPGKEKYQELLRKIK